MTNHAKDCAESTAQIIEALYELYCWDWWTGDNPDPLTNDAVQLVEELEREHGSLMDCRDVQAIITSYAREMALEVLQAHGTYVLLLTTGGPSIRVTGELYQGEPSYRAGERPDVQWCDGWNDWTVSDYRVSSDALLWFACLFFG